MCMCERMYGVDVCAIGVAIVIILSPHSQSEHNADFCHDIKFRACFLYIAVVITKSCTSTIFIG